MTGRSRYLLWKLSSAQLFLKLLNIILNALIPYRITLNNLAPQNPSNLEISLTPHWQGAEDVRDGLLVCGGQHLRPLLPVLEPDQLSSHRVQPAAPPPEGGLGQVRHRDLLAADLRQLLRRHSN